MLKPKLHLVTPAPHTRLPVYKFMEEEASIIIRVSHEKSFTDPDEAFAYQKLQETFYPEAKVQAIRKSTNDLPVLSLLVLQHAQKFFMDKEFCKADMVPLYERWRYSEKSIYPVLSRLAREGHLVRVRQGWYMLSE